jgi:hypothetical protein
MATKTIIITAVPASRTGSIGPFAIKKAPVIASTAGGNFGKISYATISSPVPSPSISGGLKRSSPTTWENVEPNMPRKRERLTHLSQDEKLNRRKLKNRIAAQTARDRKKVKMNCLEDTVDDLQANNEALALENSKLSQQTAQLLEENARLKKELEESNRQKELLKRKSEEAVVGSSPVALGSAAGAGDGGDQHGLSLDPPDHALEAIIRDLLEGSEEFQLGPEGTELELQQNQLRGLEGTLESEPAGSAFLDFEINSEANPALAIETESPVESSLLPVISLGEDSATFLSGSVTDPPPSIITSSEILKPSSPFGIVPTSPRNDLVLRDSTYPTPTTDPFVNFEMMDKNQNDKIGLGGSEFDFEDSDLSSFLMDSHTTSPMWADNFTDLFQTTA